MVSTPDLRPGTDGPGLHIHVDVCGNGQANIVGQGTQNIDNLGARPARTAVVVEQVVADQAAARSLFVGRDIQVDQLLGLLDPSGSGPATAVVSAIGGLAGVGKTALARHVAQIAVGQGWFPGGAVFIDLNGYDPDLKDRVAPGQVFGPLLRALGVPAEQIPPTLDGQAAVYHHHLAWLAEQGRPVLLVLDNASDVDQLTGLLPTYGVHRVLVTSRHTLGDLDGVRILDLDVLDTAEAAALVDQALRERNPADRRAIADPGHTAELAEACGYLPLALRIAAALLADGSGMTVTDLAEELADTATRLDTLAYGSRAVAAAFDLSWQHLSEHDPAAARLFRLLPVNPGPDLSVDTAAALAGLSPSRVRPLLRALRRAHLVEPGTTPGRWRMHDLVRAYAIRLADDHVEPENYAAATARLLDHYLTTADAANDHLTALPGQPVPGRSTVRFTGRDQALAWLDIERPNLTAAVDLAAATGDHNITVRLATAMAHHLSWRRHLHDWVTVATTACHAAQHLANPHYEAVAWTNLGITLGQVRRFDEAITALEHARDIYQQTRDHHGEAGAWTNLGVALREVRRFEEAITALECARDIYQQTGDRHREGMAWNNLGTALGQVRRFEVAITAHEIARYMFQRTGDRHGEGMAWNNLGTALGQVRRFDEAITAHQTARDIYQQTGDRHGEGMAWNNLGTALGQVRRFDEAITAHHRDLEICREIGDRHGEGSAWNNLGIALREVRRFEEAITAHTTARDIYQQTGDRHREGMAWNNLGIALVRVGRFGEAITALEHAVAAYTESGAIGAVDEVRRSIKAIKGAQSEK